MKTPKKFTQPVYKDNRGSFVPVKLEDNWIQSNLSINDNPYTWRGLHFQVGPRRQSKYITVIKGRVIDVIVCLTGDKIGEVEVYELKEGEGLFVPKNYAHGFLTLESGTIVSYFVDEIYSKEHEVSVHWMSVPEVKKVVESHLGNNQLVISDKDNVAIEFNEYIQK
jgi:dTDP-4-dehydrorhamnose 3,5-epimerase-like enzyme